MSFLLCDPVNRKIGKDRLQSQEEMTEVYSKMKENVSFFMKNEQIARWGYSNEQASAETFSFLFEKYTGKVLHLDVQPITTKDARMMKSGLKEFARDLKRTGSTRRKLWAPFRIPAADMRKFPELQRFQENFKREASHFRRYSVENESYNKVIVDNWEKLSAEVGGKESVKEFRNLELELDQLLADTNPSAAQLKKLNAAQIKYSNFLMKGATSVYRDFTDVMHGVDIETLEGYTPRQKRMWREIDSNMEKIRFNGAKILSSALSKVMETAKMMDKREGSFRNLENTVKYIADAMRMIEFQSEIDRKAYRPKQSDYEATSELEALGFTKGDFVHFRKYMPHKILGMVKVLKDMNRRILEGDKNETMDEVMEHDWDNFRKTVESAMHRSSFESPHFSRDPAFFLRQYTHEISQFNFQAHLENNFRKQANALMDLTQKNPNEKDRKLEKAVGSLIKQMDTMKATLVNIDPKADKAISDISRLLTSVQYFRLMGGNVRSATRNGTQRIYEFIHFGARAWKHARDYYKKAGGTKNLAMMTEEAKRHGLLYHVEAGKGKLRRTAQQEQATRGAIAESGIPSGFKVGADGTLHREGKLTPLKKTAEIASDVANRAGFLHRGVENWNRKGTFQTAFALAHMNLKDAPDSWLAQEMYGWKGEEAIRKGMDKLKTAKGKEEFLEKKDPWIQKKSGDMAYNAVSDLHFEYAKWAKAPGIRGPKGQVVGQFLHYRFSLADLMSRWWKDGIRAMKARDFNRDEAWRLYRLGMLQSMVTATSIYSGHKLSSLVENDVWETSKQLWLMMFADRKDPAEMERLQEATYRQGVMSFAGPTIGWGVQLGEWMNWIELDPNGIPGHPTQQIIGKGEGYTRQQAWKGRQLINSQYARTSTYSFPILLKQNLLDMLTMEAGLFPDAKLKEQQKYARRLTRKIPLSIRKLKDPFGSIATVAEAKYPKGMKPRRLGTIAGPGKKVVEQARKYTPMEIAKVQSSLDAVRGEGIYKGKRLPRQ